MKYYNGCKSKNYFEGWYFRHLSGDRSISFIPSIACDSHGKKSCYIQVVTNSNSYKFKFDYSEFSAKKDCLNVKIGNNIFSEDGCSVDLVNKDVYVKATFKYSKFEKIQGDIMGIFSHFPFMQCSHGVISMRHNVSGSYVVNNTETFISGGVGYIEKDSGRSFPSKYLWLQANDFSSDLSLFVSIATIPFMGIRFKGLIAVALHNGKEYRFATYNNSKILKSFIYDKSKEPILELKHGKDILRVDFFPSASCELLAPNCGKMNRKVLESLDAKINVKMTNTDNTIFFDISNNAGLEYSL